MGELHDLKSGDMQQTLSSCCCLFYLPMTGQICLRNSIRYRDWLQANKTKISTVVTNWKTAEDWSALLTCLGEEN